MGLRVRTGPMVSADHVVRRPRAREPARGHRRHGRRHGVGRDRARAPGDRRLAVVRVIVDTALQPGRPAGHRAGRRPRPADAAPTGPALRHWAEPRRPARGAARGARARSARRRARHRHRRTGAVSATRAPVYVRRQIVHNAHVVADLQRQGAVFVEELDQVPDGTTVVFSAHGVAPAVRAEAARREPQRHRRDLPAGREGAHRGPPVRRPRRHRAAHRARGPRRGRGHAGRGPGPVMLVENADDAERSTLPTPTGSRS